MSQLLIPYPSKKPKRPLDKKYFARELLVWYQVHKRRLPWRETNDPYRIWLSEVILQQTRVAQGLPYYQRFIEKYPTVQALAAAEETAVLRLWQGLGYYSRARHLHACAHMIVNKFHGKFPNNYKELLHLKGVGTYTAAAIASIAFNEPVPVVDGNVYRVLARVFGIEEDIASIKGKKVFYELAQSLVPKEKANLYSQAIMDFGAIQCTPLKPRCNTCIFKDSCSAFYTNRQYTLPVKNRHIKIKKRFFHYFVIQAADKLYMKRRGQHDIWEGLYDFYLVEDKALKAGEQLEDELIALLQHHQIAIPPKSSLYKHLLTHQQLYIAFFSIKVSKQFIHAAKQLFHKVAMRAFTLEETQVLPKSILTTQFLEQEFYS